MANEIVGARSSLVLADETTWSVTPQTPAYIPIPVLEYGVRFRPQNRQARAFLGLFERKHSKNFRGLVSGPLRAPFYGWRPSGLGMSLAQFLLDWGCSQPEAQDLHSKLAEWAEGPNIANKRHTGLRVDSCVLDGSADTGEVQITLSLQGAAELGQDVVPTAQAVPASRSLLTSAEFADCACQLGGAALPLHSFRVEVQNGLKAEYLNSFTPSLLVRTQRLVRVQLVPVKNSDVYEALNRAAAAADLAGQLVIQALQNGTGTTGMNWTVLTIALPRLSLLQAESQGGLEDIWLQPLNFVALKPDSTSPDVAFTWSESA